MEKVVLYNMCMIEDGNGNVVVLDRIDNEWSGYTFPGGHVEKNESFTDSVIREVYEETGLQIKDPEICGLKQWYEDEVRNVLILYRANCCGGDLRGSEEGNVFWLPLQELKGEKLASGFEYTLRVFLDEDIKEQVSYEENGQWNYYYR